MYTWSQGRPTKAKSVDRALSCILGVTKRDIFWGLPNMYPESYDCGLPGHLAVMRAAMMEPGVHTTSDELILQIPCNVFLAFKWILMMTSGQNISHYMTAKLSVHVWNHDLIWWQNEIDTQKHFHKTTITSSWTLSKTKIPITIVKAQMPSNPNKKSRKRENNGCPPFINWRPPVNNSSPPDMMWKPPDNNWIPHINNSRPLVIMWRIPVNSWWPPDNN